MLIFRNTMGDPNAHSGICKQTRCSFVPSLSKCANTRFVLHAGEDGGRDGGGEILYVSLIVSGCTRSVSLGPVLMVADCVKEWMRTFTLAPLPRVVSAMLSMVLPTPK